MSHCVSFYFGANVLEAPGQQLHYCYKIYLNKELGAFDIDDEWDRVVDGHTSRPVAFGNEGREPATAAVPHGEVDDQVKMVFFQVVHDAALLLFSGTIAVVILLKWPIDRCHLERTCQSAQF